jgi:16S rRNA (cytidine1402-2'-O)-methyltransferase
LRSLGLIKKSHTNKLLNSILGAGFESAEFCFRGFFPRKSKEREAELALARAARTARVFVWFESPERVGASLEAVAANWVCW